MKLLITGFEAARGELNASQILVQSLQSDELLAAYRDRLTLAILPLNRAEVAPVPRRLLDESRADLALLIGQAPRRDQLQLERFAQNLDDFTCADNGGYQPRGDPILPNGPLAYRSTLPRQEQLIERWRAQGIAAGFSNHAGNYLCNHALYQALHLQALGECDVRSAFLHIPLLPEQTASESPIPTMPLATLQHALRMAISTLLESE